VSYAVNIRPAAQRQFARLPTNIRKAVGSELEGLAEAPRPHGCRKMVGSTNGYRIRVGDYRVIYEIDDAARVVLVTVIGHRSEVYR
jgi:mRNA interferase RelE/StbE